MELNSLYLLLCSISTIILWQSCHIYRILFEITGLNKSISKFQVLSLMLGCGFSTSESELIVYDKTRRKIAFSAIILGKILSLISICLFICFLITIQNFKLLEFIGIAIGSVLLIGLCVFVNIYKPLKSMCNIKLFKKLYTKNLTETNNIIVYTDKMYDKFLINIKLNTIPEALVGLCLEEINFEELFDIKILAIENSNGFTTQIDKSYILQQGDKIEVFANPKVIKKLFSIK